MATPRQPTGTTAFPDNLGNRDIHIWGARHEGYAACCSLKRIGLAATGFIDSSPSLAGTSAFTLPVAGPDVFFGHHTPSDSFIVIASGFFADEIAARCLEMGWRKGDDFVVYGELRRLNYQVDVSGMCNLHCISCPRGNWPRHREPGLMSKQTYAALLEKILAEDPWTGIVTLYNWGEPLLNPELPEIIEATRRVGLLSAVSSNLAMRKDFVEVVKAGPDWFRISNSGWGEHYETTHTGGKWDVFLENCRKLSDYRRKYRPEMLIEFFFHIYAHNRDDYPRIRQLCDELGFTLRYRHAALAPLDNISRILDAADISPAAKKTRSIQFLQVDEVMGIAHAERDRPCYYKDHLWIDWNLSVAHCMEWYDPELVLCDNFIETSIDAIIAARQESDHCKSCMERGIHRAYCVYGDESLIAKKASLVVAMPEACGEAPLSVHKAHLAEAVGDKQ